MDCEICRDKKRLKVAVIHDVEKENGVLEHGLCSMVPCPECTENKFPFTVNQTQGLKSNPYMIVDFVEMEEGVEKREGKEDRKFLTGKAILRGRLLPQPEPAQPADVNTETEEKTEDTAGEQAAEAQQ